jgi:hypothetical protein
MVGKPLPWQRFAEQCLTSHAPQMLWLTLSFRNRFGCELVQQVSSKYLGFSIRRRRAKDARH